MDHEFFMRALVGAGRSAPTFYGHVFYGHVRALPALVPGGWPPSAFDSPDMRSKRGLRASIVLLLALPLTALYQMVLGAGVEAVIHGALALGSALMSFAVFDFKTPKWPTWMGSISTGVLAAVFFVQALSEVTHDEALTYLAYQVLGQRLEGWLVNLFMAWCVVVLVVDRKVTGRILGIVAARHQRPRGSAPPRAGRALLPRG